MPGQDLGEYMICVDFSVYPVCCFGVRKERLGRTCRVSLDLYLYTYVPIRQRTPRVFAVLRMRCTFTLVFCAVSFANSSALSVRREL